jgi:hypothetical protein
MLLSLRRILVVKRVWVASGDGLIELILILVRWFVGRRGEVRLRGRLIGHLEDQDEQLARVGSFEVKPRRIVQAVMYLDGARRWSGVAEKVAIYNKTYALELAALYSSESWAAVTCRSQHWKHREQAGKNILECSSSRKRVDSQDRQRALWIYPTGASQA